AMAMLGEMYLSGGGGLSKDDAAALRWLRKAADEGDGFAMGRLGDFSSAVRQDSRGMKRRRCAGIERVPQPEAGAPWWGSAACTRWDAGASRRTTAKRYGGIVRAPRCSTPSRCSNSDRRTKSAAEWRKTARKPRAGMGRPRPSAPPMPLNDWPPLE